MSRVRDLLVLGGGPAGCAAALHGAAKGLRVTLLERAPFPRDRPGESLHPGVEPLFAMLGVRERIEGAGFPRIPGIHRVTRGEHSFEPFGRDENGPWQGFQAWRADLDRLLLDEARQRGVEVLQPAAATGVLHEDGRLAGVTVRGTSLRARHAVDASGRGGWLSRQLGLPWQVQSPRLIAWYGYQEASPADPRWDEPTFEMRRAGWCWSGAVRPGLVHWTRLSLKRARRRDDERRIPGHLAGLPTAHKARGADVTWRIASRTAGPGFFLTGDAASVVDPGASHGVLKALITGIRAADTAAAIRDAPSREPELVDGYDRWLRDWHRREVTRLAEAYRGLAPSVDWLWQVAPREGLAGSTLVENVSSRRSS